MVDIKTVRYCTGMVIGSFADPGPCGSESIWEAGSGYALKILINEKRCGLKVLAFDRSPFKLFTLRFLNKIVQASSCERPKTTQRNLFLSS
jgi:hypothetical protein